ncbi:hypothetical protein L1K71_23635, partial [Salmonella enterica subsp. enterica serovar Anatum]|nr:hypothetical protein [Salmonella enterica subsp. enterica serovar Anatum]
TRWRSKGKAAVALLRFPQSCSFRFINPLIGGHLDGYPMAQQGKGGRSAAPISAVMLISVH